MARVVKDRFAQNRELLDGMQQVSESMKSWKPATEVLTKVQAVPTVFPQYDVATRVMGHPIARFCLVHGPSGEGKTSFMLGLMKSFLEKGHFAGFADAERTTPPDWVVEVMGDYAGHPAFSALPVDSYEGTVDAVREYCETIAEARVKGLVPEETSGIIVIDSIRKLVPKNLMKELEKSGTSKKGVDGFGGRAGQIKAALNAAWCDELVPLLANTRMAMVMIARETKDPEADMWSEGIKVGGGTALFYDSSLAIRVSRKFIKHPEDNKAMIGERHRVEIRKTKLARREEKIPVAYFHTSSGLLSPAGLDRARDVLELAVKQDVVQQRGPIYKHGGRMLGKGELRALDKLRATPELLEAIEVEARQAASESW